ncbi:MAG: glycerophosphodiester phosphodiesterase family protein [Rubricoccaceae bacterium]|nr:glycerophosphodiester phosphodiesterase family protein [Rubricoccaceae bacterium]
MSGIFEIHGHRGARGLAPENTLPSFRRALDLGVTALEMDVVISQDRQVVVSHDPWMSSAICSKPDGSPVSKEEENRFILFRMPYEDIKRFDCGKRGHPEFPRQVPQPVHKPLLRDVIEMAEEASRTLGGQPIHYNVETKSSPEHDGQFHPDPQTFVELIWKVVEEFDVADRFILQSFDVRTLQVARQMELPVRISMLVKRRWLSRLGHLRSGLRQLGFVPDIYSPWSGLVSKRVVRHAHELGMSIIPWTVNEVADMYRLQRIGVDGLITDYPDVATSALLSG